MISPTIEKALNDQLNFELYSSYIYLSMAAYFESTDLTGCAQWMKSQTIEEVVHSQKFYGYINERGGRVKLAAINAPKTEWNSPLEAFEEALSHEREVTRRINAIMDMAIAEKDHATQIFLQWFITEQVEEEASVNAVVQRMKLASQSPGGLFMVDKELGSRPINLTALEESEDDD